MSGQSSSQEGSAHRIESTLMQSGRMFMPAVRGTVQYSTVQHADVYLKISRIAAFPSVKVWSTLPYVRTPKS